MRYINLFPFENVFILWHVEGRISFKMESRITYLVVKTTNLEANCYPFALGKAQCETLCAFIFVNVCNTHLDLRMYSFLPHPTLDMPSSFNHTTSYLFLQNFSGIKTVIFAASNHVWVCKGNMLYKMLARKYVNKTAGLSNQRWYRFPKRFHRMLIGIT